MVVDPTRWVRCDSTGAEHVTAIAHVIVTHEHLTGKRHKKYQKKEFVSCSFLTGLCV